MSRVYTDLNGIFGPTNRGPISDEAQEDSLNKMWSGYLEDVKEFDKGLTETWKEDAGGVLTFTAIFSATVATFIVESYKMLSPDRSTQTVLLLRQLSQQSAGFANGTYVKPQTYPDSSPSISVVWINSIWLLSLMLSTTSALFATLTQQWARRYLQLPQMRSVPRDRARVRSSLFLGTIKYAMYHTVETAPTLLHLSVLLFNIGLVLFFFTIYKPVAVVVLAVVVLFGSVYFVLTLLPCLDHFCPYLTPLSSISWYLWHALAFLMALMFRLILKLLHTLLVPYNPGDVESGSRIQAKLVDWLDNNERFLEHHRQRLEDGFRGSIVNDAIDAPDVIDIKALSWLFQLPALADKSKIEKFMAAIPGKTIIQLFCMPYEDKKVTFRNHLLALLRSCDPGIVGLDESVRSRRLSVCLDVIRYIVRAAFPPTEFLLPQSLLSEVRKDFASLSTMRVHWADGNPAIRVTARSICALLARNLLHKSQLEQSELIWLEDVLEQPSNAIFNQPDVVDNMNIDSFVYGALSHQTDDLPISQVTTFVDTLAILMSSGSQTDLRRDTFRSQLFSLIRRMEQGDDENRDNVVNQLRSIFQGLLSIEGEQPQASNT